MSSYHGWTHAPKAQGGTDPIPVSGGTAPVEWANYRGQSGWADDRTTQEFVLKGGNYDIGTPTFDLDAGNLTISKGGAYTIDTWVYDLIVADTTLFYSVELSMARVAGPAITGWFHSWATNVFLQTEKFYWIANAPTGANGQLFPFFHEFLDVPMDADFSTPLQFEVKAVYIENGVFVTASIGYVQMLVVRLGDTFP